MWCAICLQEVHGVTDHYNHRSCMEEIWHVYSEEYTRVRAAAKNQYDFVPKGATVEVRPPLTRSVSESNLNTWGSK
jgi:hypothetical protein